MKFDLRTSRREPRGFDEQWAANAAELEKWRSAHVAVPTGLGHRVRQRPPRREQRPPREEQRPLRSEPGIRKEKTSHAWVTVVAGGLAVGGLIVYLLVTLADIRPPKEVPRPTDVRAKDSPVEVKRVSSPPASAAPKIAR
jgi:hypothetical protein